MPEKKAKKKAASAERAGTASKRSVASAGRAGTASTKKVASTRYAGAATKKNRGGHERWLCGSYKSCLSPCAATR
jgi:hypothetical protein